MRVVCRNSLITCKKGLFSRVVCQKKSHHPQPVELLASEKADSNYFLATALYSTQKSQPQCDWLF